MGPKKWCETTNTGRYGGTFAHQDIAAWISVEFKLYLIKEFQRLKQDEIDNQKLGWDIKRTLVKMNYHIHADAIKNNLIPPNIATDLLNVALFGLTAKAWSESKLEGNMRDYATACRACKS